MNFEVCTSDEQKVRDFMEKEGIPFESAESSHEMVVKAEAMFIKEGLVCELEYEELTEDEKNRRIALLEEAAKKVHEDSESVVNEDYSFFSVQEAVRSRIQELLGKDNKEG